MKKLFLLTCIGTMTFGLCACGSAAQDSAATAETSVAAEESADTAETSETATPEATEAETPEATETVTAEPTETATPEPPETPEATEEPTEDPSTIVPENPDYDSVYGPLYEEIRNSDGLSDYANLYFADSNGDGVMEMWIEKGETTTDVYTIRESGAVLIDAFDTMIPYEQTVELSSMDYRMINGYWQVPWPGWDTIMSTWIGA